LIYLPDLLAKTAVTAFESGRDIPDSSVHYG
jgi:hypothetical protein